jgi:hypothetical protein
MRYALALRWEDERGHGTEKLDCWKKGNCQKPEGCNGGFVSNCKREIPTFALLLDRPGDELCEAPGCDGGEIMDWVSCPICSGTGKQSIPGTLSTLIQELRYGGDPLAEELGKLHIWSDVCGTWSVSPCIGQWVVCRSRLDALRELHRRVLVMLQKEWRK